MKSFNPFRILLLIFITITSVAPLFGATTGKISGIVRDKSSGEPLPGASIVIQGTLLGASTDLEGTYTILHVSPGVYTIEVTYMGYTKVQFTEVKVSIDQTTRLDAELEPEVLETAEIVIVAERDILRPDVATSVVSVTETEVEALSTNNIMGVLGVQAGVRDGQIRGVDLDRALFQVNGVTLRDPRNNNAVTGIPLTSVDEVSMEKGGFNAEYGQVQSGIVKVVTKEGGRNKYSAKLQMRYSPPAPKYWRGTGILDLHDPYSYVLRPFFDPDVCWTGTDNGAWDEYMNKQYPDFVGWNEISRVLNSDNDPTNDLTPLGAQRVFMYETRKAQPNDEPDYEIDGGFGGPVPFVGKMLGDLRFYTSYRSNREMLLFPLSRPDYSDYTWTMQLTSDITPSMKLRFFALTGKEYTIRHNWDDPGKASYYYPRWPNEIAGVAANVGSTFGLIGLFSDYNFSLADIGHKSYSMKLTHTIDSKTYYDLSLEYFESEYHVRPQTWRDTTKLYEIIPGYYQDSNPYGYLPGNSRGVLITGGMHLARARDFSKVSASVLSFDFSKQFDFHNLFKAGFKITYNDLNLDYGIIKSGSEGKAYGARVTDQYFPITASAYIQDKLEFEGLTANLGLRLDYSNSNATWWDVNPYDANFFSDSYSEENEFKTRKTKPQWQISPRLGIAHPISENAKLFFNYGHYKQLPQYEGLFRLQRTDKRAMSSYGNPDLTLAKTISYELGFDYILPTDILVQLSAFYNDVYDQTNYVTYYSSISGFSYNNTSSNAYEDNRGVELTVRKSTGNWWNGFINYTYQVRSTGNFGSEEKYDDQYKQKKFDDETKNLYQDRPIARPYARANLNFFTPTELGPSLLGHHIFGDFNLNVLLDWQAGEWFTWNPNEVPGIEYNVQGVDYFNTNLRLTKNINIGDFSVQFFMDMSNVFNAKRLWDNQDQDYLRSLHLPVSDAYPNIPGDDKIGDYREPGTAFQPMKFQETIDPEQSGTEGVIYYIGSTKNYYEYVDDLWVKVSQSRMNKIKETKAYIDMPNASTFWFLNPRDIFFGIRLSLQL